MDELKPSARLKNYLNIKICKKCGGRCCKKMPGGALPEDFGKPLLDNLEKAFATGKWAVDWWEGDPTGKNEVDGGYFIRPKAKGMDKIYEREGGECIFLIIGKGCELSESERPGNCRLLEPKKEGLGYCILHGVSKQEIAIAWMPYHKTIHKAAGGGV